MEKLTEKEENMVINSDRRERKIKKGENLGET